MKWVVLEENPKADNYIAVVVTEQNKLRVETLAHSVFERADDAMARARALREKFGVHTIRIFRSESHPLPNI